MRSTSLHQLVQARHIERPIDFVDLVVAAFAGAAARRQLRVVMNLLFRHEHLQQRRIHPAPTSRAAPPRFAAAPGAALRSTAACRPPLARAGRYRCRASAETSRDPRSRSRQTNPTAGCRSDPRASRSSACPPARPTQTAATPAAPAPRRTIATARSRSPAPASRPDTTHDCETAGSDGSDRSPSASARERFPAERTCRATSRPWHPNPSSYEYESRPRPAPAGSTRSNSDTAEPPVARSAARSAATARSASGRRPADPAAASRRTPARAARPREP